MSRRRILDTSVLIQHWKQCRSTSRRRPTRQGVSTWAAQLIQLRDKYIVTPVRIEFLAGATSAEEGRLFRTYLEKFLVLDDGSILVSDWQEAERLAQRVPRDGKPRQLGDCLIRAIAERLNCDVVSFDKSFP